MIRKERKGQIVQVLTTTNPGNQKIEFKIFKIKWEKQDKSQETEYTLMESGLVKANFPLLLLQFYQKKVQFIQKSTLKIQLNNLPALTNKQNPINKISICDYDDIKYEGKNINNNIRLCHFRLILGRNSTETSNSITSKSQQNKQKVQKTATKVGIESTKRQSLRSKRQILLNLE